MTKKDIKLQQIAELKQKYGENYFKQDSQAISLDSRTDLLSMAKLVGYQRPKHTLSCLTRAGFYYLHLKRIADNS